MSPSRAAAGLIHCNIMLACTVPIRVYVIVLLGKFRHTPRAVPNKLLCHHCSCVYTYDTHTCIIIRVHLLFERTFEASAVHSVVPDRTHTIDPMHRV